MRRSGIRIMGSLIGLVRPLLGVMALAVFMGTVGYLCAIFLTVTAAAGVLEIMGMAVPPMFPAKLSGVFVMLGSLAVLRGVLHYIEQECNHYIAFKLLAVIRHKVFAALRRLCPAKLEGRDRGDLISVITSDIELLEVFYAHTISPIAIAVLTCLVLIGFVGAMHPLCGVLAAAGYVTVGVMLPLWNARRGAAAGVEYREEFAGMNSFLLESLRGIGETIRYGRTAERLAGLEERSGQLSGKQRRLTLLSGDVSAVTGACITGFSFAMLFLNLYLFGRGAMSFSGAVLAAVAMMSSFGPVTALSELSNNLNQTLACGERVLRILEETPEVEEVRMEDACDAESACNAESSDGAAGAAAVNGGEIASRGGAASGKKCDGWVPFTGAELSHVEFSYGAERILYDVSLRIPKGKILGIHGKSGSGKSTILKLLMRFWDVDGGEIRISGRDIRTLDTSNLRQLEGYVTQETVLFHDTIAANIGIGKPGASREEIVAAAKKASLHAFVESLPDGYDTMVGEQGESLSGGERQRIGIARAFLHESPFLLLDEPTSNLDSLNEGMILKALYEERADRTVVLVSHRKSTMGIADAVYEMEEKRVS